MRPARSSRSTWPDIAGAEIPSSEASSASERPGLRFTSQSKRRLAGRDPELLGLLPQLACEPQKHRPELGGCGLGAKRNLANH